MISNLYYNPKTGFSGIGDISRKSGLSPQVVKQWMQKQNVYTLHKPIKHKFPTRRVIVSRIDDQWQADLVDMQSYKSQNNQHNYILTVIDIFSKFAWAIPIRKKTGEEVKKAFVTLFKERIPSKIQTDKGLEFINKTTQDLFKKHKVHWFSTENETKAQVVERFNRTLKSKMWKYFTHTNSRKWIDILQALVHNYNNSFHRSIKMTPTEGSLKKNSSKVYKALFPSNQSYKGRFTFSIGDRVRISKKYKEFRKGYLPNFTTEIFIVSEILKTNPVTYRLKDLNGEELLGSFYEEEMSRYDSEIYEIEKVLKKSKGKMLVKWRGYEKPSWINEQDVQNST